MRLPFSESNEKFTKTLTKSSLYLQIINIISTLLGTLEALDHSFKLNVMFSMTAALFMNVIFSAMKTMSENPSKMLF